LRVLAANRFVRANGVVALQSIERGEGRPECRGESKSGVFLELSGEHALSESAAPEVVASEE
jgi:hypothetical protein|tara:strand:- start:2312 stop:2497 length:186 start_codon:yes stop_codon:yes gene_type:complete